jgi:hypothetical protein
MTKETQEQEFFTALKEVKSDLEKQMVLQKYGMIEPKLTEHEKLVIAYTEKLAEIEPYIRDWRPVDLVFEAPVGKVWEGKL